MSIEYSGFTSLQYTKELSTVRRNSASAVCYTRRSKTELFDKIVSFEGQRASTKKTWRSTSKAHDEISVIPSATIQSASSHSKILWHLPPDPPRSEGQWKENLGETSVKMKCLEPIASLQHSLARSKWEVPVDAGPPPMRALWNRDFPGTWGIPAWRSPGLCLLPQASSAPSHGINSPFMAPFPLFDSFLSPATKRQPSIASKVSFSLDCIAHTR